MKLIINEVDCYRGNAFRIDQVATHPAVQHQIILIDEDSHEWYIKNRNRVADLDRGERVVESKWVPKKIKDLFLEAINIQAHMKSEYCNSVEEFEQAAEYNRPFRAQLKEKVREIYSIESLGLDFDTFHEHIVY